MNQNDKDFINQTKISEIISKCHCCRLAFIDNGVPYIVPLNFGFEKTEEQLVLYFHGAGKGRKIDLIKKGNIVGFEMDTNYILHEADEPCEYSAGFQSIIGTGFVSFVTDNKDKEHALSQIMFNNTGKTDWEFPEKMVAATTVFKLVVNEISFKENK